MPNDMHEFYSLLFAAPSDMIPTPSTTASRNARSPFSHSRRLHEYTPLVSTTDRNLGATRIRTPVGEPIYRARTCASLLPASAMYAGALRTALLRAARAAPRRHALFAPSAGGPQPSPHSAAACAPTPSSSARRSFAAKADVSDVIPEVKEGTPGETPSIFDQATGLERAEIDHPDLFKHNEVLRGPFGTAENPVMIQSNFDARIVGCTGQAPPEDHDLFWINVEKGQIATCGQCGQCFSLDPL
jgi:uncharacterized Zn-finger protein